MSKLSYGSVLMRNSNFGINLKEYAHWADLVLCFMTANRNYSINKTTGETPRKENS